MFTQAEVSALVAGARLIRAFGGAAMARASEEALVKIAAVLPEGARRSSEEVSVHAFQGQTDPALRHRIDALDRLVVERRPGFPNVPPGPRGCVCSAGPFKPDRRKNLAQALAALHGECAYARSEYSINSVCTMISSSGPMKGGIMMRTPLSRIAGLKLLVAV